MNEVVQIPKEWRDRVCRLLDAGTAMVPLSVYDRWEEMFTGQMTTLQMMLARVSEALKVDGVRGIKVETMRNETGEVYEFLFPMSDVGATVYVKVSLRSTPTVVYFYSAHRAEREYL